MAAETATKMAVNISLKCGADEGIFAAFDDAPASSR